MSSLGSASPTELTDTFSTVGVCRLQRACLRLQSMTCPSLMTACLTPWWRRTCKGAWTSSQQAEPILD
ncbi:unnamed protein product [Schistocephalus solidus]|uniref:Uncharacterized protein n=1 Tax=Schistocephalus solidus TaxID=70667 RepID=A0A183SAK3_SCHSO|nr:unnamed protein product [Schistocephalus solidus]